MSVSRRMFMASAFGAAGAVATSHFGIEVPLMQTADTDIAGSTHNLIAHWKLNGDCEDSAGTHHGDGQNIQFVEGRDGRPKGAAFFNGVNALIHVEDDGDWWLGTQEFTID